MKTDNSNIVVPESLEDAAKNHFELMDISGAIQGFEKEYEEWKEETINVFKEGANWQKEQYKPILESHKKLVESFSHILQWTKTKDGKGEFKTSKEQIDEFKMQLFESMEIKNKLNIQ